MPFSLFYLLGFLLLISFNFSSAWPLPRSCKANLLNGGSSPSPSSSAPSTTPTTASNTTKTSSPPPPPCFPALSFQMPSSVPDSLDNWWCPMDIEYGFVGFSYEITACSSLRAFSSPEADGDSGQSLTQLKQDFADIRNTFSGRYVRLYGFCDNSGF
jgi:hypothetical protein